MITIDDVSSQFIPAGGDLGVAEYDKDTGEEISSVFQETDNSGGQINIAAKLVNETGDSAKESLMSAIAEEFTHVYQ